MGRQLKTIEKKISEAQKQLEEAQKELAEYKRTQKLVKPEIGGAIEVADIKWTVLDKTEAGYLCLAEKLNGDMTFDSRNNNWSKSELREYLNTEFFYKIAVMLGEENVVPFKRDLLSLDGQTEYGTCEDRVSMLTVDEYRKYRKLIPNTGYWWWTITPDTTECNGNAKWVLVVSPAGNVNRNCFNDDGGVRPFCIFSSAIFESEEK